MLRNVRSGLILRRINSRMIRDTLTSALRPCTRNTSAPGSTRPRAATMSRNANECLAIAGTSSAVFAFSGSMMRVTIGMCAGQTSSHL
jgi:hypothetical protein